MKKLKPRKKNKNVNSYWMKQIIILFLTTLVFFINTFSVHLEYKRTENKKKYKTSKYSSWEEYNLSNYQTQILIDCIKEVENNKKITVYYNKTELNPKISFIIPIFNKQKYLSFCIKSIQNQLLKEIEIIMVDDCSTDNSSQIIKKFLSEDKRILGIKNKKNMGVVYSRYIGSINCKGNYIYFVDPDDFLFKKGLAEVYNYAVYLNLDILQFSSVGKSGKNLKGIWKSEYFQVIRQPKLSNIMYYYNENLAQTNNVLWNKIFRNTIIRKTYDFYDHYYINQRIPNANDMLTIFAIFRLAETFSYINKFIYCYNICQDGSVSKDFLKLGNEKKIITGFFIHFKFVFEQTSNTKFDKGITMFLLRKFYHLVKFFDKINEGLEFVNQVLEMFLKCKFFDGKDKIFITGYKNEVNKFKNIRLNFKRNRRILLLV